MKTLAHYEQEMRQVLATGDLNKMREHLAKYNDNPPDMPDKPLEVTMYKLRVHYDVKADEARQWLKDRGYTTKIKGVTA